jgi:uncharacterized protein YccT (UPF0319 family)
MCDFNGGKLWPNIDVFLSVYILVNCSSIFAPEHSHQSALRNTDDLTCQKEKLNTDRLKFWYMQKGNKGS